MSESVTLDAPVNGALPPVRTEADQKKILGKFSTQAELEKSYLELEKKLGASKKEAPEPPKTPEQPATPPVSLQVEADEDPFNKYTAELQTTGKLSDESYEAIKKQHGLGRKYIDAHLQGLKAMAETQASVQRKAAADIVGSEEALTAHLQWAKENFQPAERDAFNQAVNSGNIESIKQAVAGLKHRYETTNGREPTLVGGRAAGGNDGSTFRSWQEVTRAMSDRRYRNDPAYQKDVQDKISRSQF